MWHVKFYNLKNKFIWLEYKWMFGTFKNIFTWREQLDECKVLKNKLVKGIRNLIFKDIDGFGVCKIHGIKHF